MAPYCRAHCLYIPSVDPKFQRHLRTRPLRSAAALHQRCNHHAQRANQTAFMQARKALRGQSTFTPCYVNAHAPLPSHLHAITNCWTKQIKLGAHSAAFQLSEQLLLPSLKFSRTTCLLALCCLACSLSTLVAKSAPALVVLIA